MSDDEDSEHSEHPEFLITVTAPEGNFSDEDTKSSEILVDLDVENIIVSGRDVQVINHLSKFNN